MILCKCTRVVFIHSEFRCSMLSYKYECEELWICGDGCSLSRELWIIMLCCWDDDDEATIVMNLMACTVPRIGIVLSTSLNSSRLMKRAKKKERVQWSKMIKWSGSTLACAVCIYHRNKWINICLVLCAVCTHSFPFILCWFFFPIFHCCMAIVFVLWICIPDEWNDRLIEKKKKILHYAFYDRSVVLFTTVSMIFVVSLFCNIFVLFDRPFQQIRKITFVHVLLWKFSSEYWHNANLFIGICDFLIILISISISILHSAALFCGFYRVL